jgi:hypothetical protein
MRAGAPRSADEKTQRGFLVGPSRGLLFIKLEEKPDQLVDAGVSVAPAQGRSLELPLRPRLEHSCCSLQPDP